MLLGHQWALEAFGRAVAGGQAAHAYLITGPRHVGKRTTCLAMAKVLLCAQGSGCDACRSCSLASRLAHPDLRILERPTERRTIPIKDVHEFIQGIALKPLEAPRKVYIIADADSLSIDGADALLKTLEEPPPAVTLFLTAPDPALLPPTVASRCQRLSLRPVPAEGIRDYLVENYGTNAAQAEAIARASQGRPGWAVLAAQHPELVEQRRQWALDLLTLVGASRLDRIQHADRLAQRWPKEADSVRETLTEWIDVWHDLACSQKNVSAARSLASAETLGETASGLPTAAVLEALTATILALDGLEENANPRLAIETLVLSLPRPRSAATA